MNDTKDPLLLEAVTKDSEAGEASSLYCEPQLICRQGRVTARRKALMASVTAGSAAAHGSDVKLLSA